MAKRKTKAEKDRDRRMKWWRDARFGMFVHWGLYSILERHEWVMNRERIPLKEYEKLADRFDPKKNCMRDWCKLAKKAGQKYVVMTTKHHEGYCLWDSDATDYCAGKTGPGRDLVAEYVDACRRNDLRVGFYYSLMDWHHPDGHLCAVDEKARRRFVDYTQELVRELMTKYGKIDILWYDVSWPLPSPEAWESKKMNAMVRKLQPDIIINNRSQLPEDFGTPEEHIRAEDAGRDWEACMTYNGSWGYQPTPDEDWRSNREVVEMLRQVTSGGGNLLLNIGPKAGGSVPEEAKKRLRVIGKWIDTNQDVIYGTQNRVEPGQFEWSTTGRWSMGENARTAYFWCSRWPGSELAVGGLRTKLEKVTLVGGGKKSYTFTQKKDRVVISGLPEKCPDRHCGVAILKMEFSSKPQQKLGAGCTLIEEIKPKKSSSSKKRGRKRSKK